MRLWGVVLVMGCLAGCGFDDGFSRGEVRVSLGFEGEEILQVIRGANKWCEVDVWCPDVVVVPHEEANIYPADPRDDAPEVLGTYFPSRGVVEVYVENHVLEIDTIVWNVAHELGHAISERRGHPDCDECLMSEDRDFEGISQDDIDWVTEPAE